MCRLEGGGERNCVRHSVQGYSMIHQNVNNFRVKYTMYGRGTGVNLVGHVPTLPPSIHSLLACLKKKQKKTKICSQILRINNDKADFLLVGNIFAAMVDDFIGRHTS